MRLGAALVLAIVGVSPLGAQVTQPQAPRPTFKAGVDRVTITAVVHKRNGQPVTDLKQEDFDVMDNGAVRPILEFRSEPTPATVALLVDFSGSMNLALKVPAVRSAAAEIVDSLTPGVDRIGLFAFDTQLHPLQPLTPAPGDVLRQLERVHPFGSTSLFDAVAETGRVLAADGSRRRAVVTLTDGGENSSRLTVSEVSRMASEIDVPVYIIVVVSPLDRDVLTKSETRAASDVLANSRLGNLAHWTGGEIFLASTDLHGKAAAAQIIDELRHQYFIGFAPDTGRPGWHPIDVRTRQKDLVVRTRSGYVAQYRPDSRD
jgi:VWFA-related protein